MATKHFGCTAKAQVSGILSASGSPLRSARRPRTKCSVQLAERRRFTDLACPEIEIGEPGAPKKEERNEYKNQQPPLLVILETNFVEHHSVQVVKGL